ncbi:MAG: hypothetical protein K0S04_4024 [Herbinix sp.]|jgi:hypothetical protein|nr:hypothetical protein [Herbinix sp.]
MNRSKKYSVAVIITTIIAVIILFYLILGGKSYIKIQNLTDTTLSNINIKYMYSNKEKIIELPNIPPKDNYKMNLLYPDDFSEGAIKLHYTDKHGEQQEEILVGYIENGYHKKIIVKVDSIDKNGILSFKVH